MFLRKLLVLLVLVCLPLASLSFDVFADGRAPSYNEDSSDGGNELSSALSSCGKLYNITSGMKTFSVYVRFHRLKNGYEAYVNGNGITS